MDGTPTLFLPKSEKNSAPEYHLYFNKSKKKDKLTETTMQESTKKLQENYISKKMVFYGVKCCRKIKDSESPSHSEQVDSGQLQLEGLS